MSEPTRKISGGLTRMLGLGTLGLAVLLGLGCATSGTTGGEGLSASETEELKRRVIELQEQARMHQVEIARLRKKVAELEARFPGTPTRAHAGQTDDPPRHPETAQPRASARSAPDLSGTEAAEPPLLEEIEIEPEPPAAPAQRPSASDPSLPESPTATPPVSPVTPAAQELYDEGYTLYHRGRYLDAESTFRRFLQAHGNSDLADNAQYWIGEARYARGDLRGALSAFRETVERYPEGNKVPDALVKAGQVLEALGDAEGARETYGAVLRRFPESPAAAVARDRQGRLP